MFQFSGKIVGALFLAVLLVDKVFHAQELLKMPFRKDVKFFCVHFGHLSTFTQFTQFCFDRILLYLIILKNVTVEYGEVY